MLEEDPQGGEIVARVAALDIGKAEVVCCVRVPHEGKPGRRLQEVQTYSTMTRSLLGMSDHLRCVGVSRVVMEATWGLLEAGVLPAGGSGVGSVAGQRQGCQAPAGPPEDRQAGRGVVVQGRGAGR